jgi:folate-binding protein YgfZ
VRGHLDLTDRVRLRLSGPDALRYLNGQVTNDVRRASPDRALRAAVCTAKGRLEAEVFIHTDGPDTFFIDGPAELRDTLPLRLEKYLIADDAALEDISETTAQFHFTGEDAETKLRTLLTADDRLVSTARLGIPGWDVFCPAERASFFREALPAIDPAIAEWTRLTHCVPAWGRELTGEILPPEARMDEDAIDYHKGCYIGQETVSRLRSVGHVNRRLELLAGPAGCAIPAAGTSLLTDDTDASLCGQVSSAAAHPETGELAVLAYVKRAAAEKADSFRLPGSPEARLILINTKNA